MLEKIKSSFFLRMVLSSLDERAKLKLIQYNKILQKEININLINYKILSGRYTIYGTNEIGKEYSNYNDKVVFEGEYMNRKRNGKGIEYNNYGKLIFEGEYLNGRRNGKGKEYNNYGKLIFEGEYLNGKRNGEGKEYYDKKLIFEGEYKNGKRWSGKIYHQGNKMINFLKDGKGYIKNYFNGNQFNNFNNNILEFEGDYLYGNKWNGKGYDLNGNIIYQLNNGNGTIREYDNLGELIFEGEYKNGRRNGKGKEYNNYERIIFEGEYINGKRNGKGKIYSNHGKLKFEGEYFNNFKIKGKEYIKSSLEYEGEYLYDKKWNGKGYNKKGEVIYELNNGNGKVKEFTYNGKLFFDGEYLNGEKWDGEIQERNFVGKYSNGKKLGENMIIFTN